MANSTQSNHNTIVRFYQNRALLRNFIQERVASDDDAADLVHEVFLRLLDYKEPILPGGVKALALAIASNVVNDYLRRRYLRDAAIEELARTGVHECNSTEEEVIGRDLRKLEQRRLATMPAQRRIVYVMRLHDEMTSRQIADELKITTRTAENHFYIGIRQMRSCFAAAI